MFKGKTALITGSTSGIGKAIAERLAADGANIVLNGFGDADEIETQRTALEADHGIKAAYDPADMTKPDQIAAMIENADSLGGVDILVNNAGIQHVAPIDEFPVEKWDQIIAINMSSVFHTIRAALPGMKEKGWGRIVNIASIHGQVASPFKSAYIAAKHGVLGITKTVALETAKQGVTVNAICPGYVLTPLVEKQIPDTAKTRGITEEEVIETVMLANQPTGKFVGTDQLAALVSFLCSDDGASMTGAAHNMDGGWTAQ